MIASNNRNITIQLVTNIVIPLATLIAVIINHLAFKSQRGGPRCEINKEILMNLNTTLSNLISQIRQLKDNGFNKMQGIPEKHKIIFANSAYQQFNRFIDHTTEIYKPVINKQILNVIPLTKNHFGYRS